MAKLKCKYCGNNKKWLNVVSLQGKYKAECYDCGSITEGLGQVEVDTVVGQMVMDY